MWVTENTRAIFDLREPSNAMQSVPHGEAPASGDIKDQGRNILWLGPKKLCNVEEGHVHLATRCPQSNPVSIRLLQFVPWPTQPECSSILAQVQNPQASKLFQPTDQLPGHLALTVETLSEPD